MKKQLISGTSVYSPQFLGTWSYADFLQDPEAALAPRLQHIAKGMFLAHGEMPLVALMYGRAIPQVDVPPAEWQRRDVVWLLELEEVHEQSKDQLNAVLRMFARPMECQAIAFLSESWAVESRPGDGVHEQLREHQARNNGSYEGFPHAREQVVLSIDTPQAAFLWQATIVRDGSKKPTLKPWEKQQVKWVSGRNFSVFAAEAPIYGA